MTTPPSAQNNRIKYAWLIWTGYSPEEARRLAKRVKMPPQFYLDLERWFFYHEGRLYFDSTGGGINEMTREFRENAEKA